MQFTELLANTEGPFGGISWRLGGLGLWVNGERPQYTYGNPVTMARVVEQYAELIRFWGDAYSVPYELIAATIATETSGNPHSVREESGFVSDGDTPHRVSSGLMQTLISTAASTLSGEVPRSVVTRQWLMEPSNSIMAGTSYIREQFDMTGFHPPMVAAAYNAGGIYEDGGENRWRMRCYPLGTGHHIDRFVLWFNDLFRL